MITVNLHMLLSKTQKLKKIKYYAFVFYCFFMIGRIYAQENHPSDHNTRNIQASDTTVQEIPEIYKDLKNISQKKKWTQKIYSTVIKEPSVPVTNPVENVPIDQEYRPYEGKTIRKIEIIVLDPFGTNVLHPDSMVTENTFNKVANKLHSSTKRSIVRNNLQFKAGQSVNPMIIAETEAYLRNLGYINDARISIIPIPLSDMVDVQVVVRDIFPVGVNVNSLSFSKADVEIFNRNFIGLGDRVSFDLIYGNNYDQKFGYGFSYKYSNLMRTFIDMEASYQDDIESQFLHLSAERPLQTSYKYFGQAFYDLYKYRTNVAGWDSISPDHNNNFSVSLGRAFDIPHPSATRRLVLAFSYLEKYPSYKYVHPSFDRFPYQYVRRKMLLGQISLYQQAYYREYLIHNYGVTENLAYGYNVSVQAGWNQFLKSSEGMYASLSISKGQQYRSGNYYVSGAVSSYFTPSRMYEGVLKGELQYFSPLLHLGAGRIRQFFNLSYAKVLNPTRVVENVLYYSDLSSLKTSDYSDFVNGQEILMMNMESDFFSPLNLIGFRFLFYTFGDIGWITAGNKLFLRDHLYGGIGVGIRIRNDLLVFKTIDIKFGYYPRLNQAGIKDYIDASSSNPGVSPSFVPGYPQEIPLE